MSPRSRATDIGPEGKAWPSSRVLSPGQPPDLPFQTPSCLTCFLEKYSWPWVKFPHSDSNVLEQYPSETWYQLLTGWPGLFLVNCWRHESVSHSAVSDSLWPHGLLPTRFLCPRDSPGKNTGVGCHSLLQRIFSTWKSNLGLLHCRQILYHRTTMVWSKWIWLQNSQKVSSSPNSITHMDTPWR